MHGIDYILLACIGALFVRSILHIARGVVGSGCDSCGSKNACPAHLSAVPFLGTKSRKNASTRMAAGAGAASMQCPVAQRMVTKMNETVTTRQSSTHKTRAHKSCCCHSK